MPFLDYEYPEGSGRRYEALDCEVIRIGRHPNADLVFQCNQLQGLHLELVLSWGQYIARDMNARNYVFINGERLTANRLLYDGDEIRLGEVVLHYHAKDIVSAPLSEFGLGSPGQ